MPRNKKRKKDGQTIEIELSKGVYFIVDTEERGDVLYPADKVKISIPAELFDDIDEIQLIDEFLYLARENDMREEIYSEIELLREHYMLKKAGNILDGFIKEVL